MKVTAPGPERIAVLMAADAPMGGYFVREILAAGLPLTAILLDQKLFGSRTHDYHHERTGGRLPMIGLETFESHKIPTYALSDVNGSASLDLIRNLGVDLCVNGGVPRMVGPGLLRAPRRGVLNCHPGLLPKYRGATCVEWAIYNNEAVGNTVHFMDEGLDSGPIVTQEPLTFFKTDSYQDIRVKVQKACFKLMAEGIRQIVTRGLTPSVLPPQPAQPECKPFKVIDSAALAVALARIAAGEYRYQVKVSDEEP